MHMQTLEMLHNRKVNHHYIQIFTLIWFLSWVCPHSTALVTMIHWEVGKYERDSFDIINIKGKRGVREKEERKTCKKKTKSGWAHHISTEPLLYVIHDRRLGANTLKGSQTTAGGQQCHNVKITPTKNKMNITFKWTSNAKIMKYREEKWIEMNVCVWHAGEYVQYLWNTSYVPPTIFHSCINCFDKVGGPISHWQTEEIWWLKTILVPSPNQKKVADWHILA